MTQAWKQWEGQTVGEKFLLREYVGGSSHSGVFLADRPGEEPERAAIKLIRADPQSAKLQLSRWEQAAKISHPHLLRLYESGRCRLGETDMLYVVIEPASEDLSQILPQRALTATEAREMLKPALEALAHLHAAGFVHGRLKPANVMVADEQVKLSIDGVCHIGDRPIGASRPSAYDPPEASSGSILPGADVWALGVTLVEALTQRLPAWERFQESEPALPDTLSAEFRDVVRHCLKRDPQRRWGLADIARWLEPGGAATPKTTSAAPRAAAAPAPASHWRHAMPTLAFALAAVVVIVVISFMNRRPEAGTASPAQADTQRAETPGSREVAPPKAPAAEPAAASAKSAPSITNTSARTNPKPSEPAKSPAREVVRGEVTQQVMPEVSEKARASIQGHVKVSVKVDVDPAGNVTSAEFESAGPSKYFADAAQRAARQWKFSPATVDGENAASQWVLRFEFTSGGTTVRPVPHGP